MSASNRRPGFITTLHRGIAAGAALAFSSLLLGCGLDSSDNPDAPATVASVPATSSPVAEVTREPTRQPMTVPTRVRTPEATASPTPASPTPAPLTPTPSPATPGADLLQLHEDMARAIDAYWSPGNFAVAVTDLQTGETVSVNGDVPLMGGCVLNLFVLYQVARDLEAGRYDLATVDRLVRATTWSSNAVTARELYAIAGDGVAKDGVIRVRELLYVLDFDAVVLDHPPSYHADGLGLDYNNWVTAVAMNQALAALWHGDVVGEAQRSYLLEVLATVKPGLNYLTAAVPEGIVSHKNGFFVGDTGYVDNDAGIVRLQRGGQEFAYAITFLSEEVPLEYGDIVLGQQLGAMAYKVMAARYPAATAAAP